MSGPPFAVLPVEVFGDARLGARDLRVLGVLYAHANDEGVCWPSRRSMAELTGIDQRHIKRTLTRLQVFGWLVVLPGVGRGRLTQYCLTVPVEKNGDPSAPFFDSETGAEPAPFYDREKGDDPGQKGGCFDQKRGPVRAEKGADPGHVEQTRNKPGTDQKQNSARAPAGGDGDQTQARSRVASMPGPDFSAQMRGADRDAAVVA